MSRGYEVRTYWNSSQGEVTKEEFLAAAQKLITKFPKASAKIIKVVH